MVINGLFKSRGCMIIFISLALLGLLSACKGHQKNTPLVPTVSVIKVQSSTIPLIKQYIGITQSISSVGIRARVKGFLIKMNFVEGKPVKKDQLLFVIDPKPFEAKLDLAKGQLSKSIANQAYQKVQYQRMKTLVAKGDISKSHYDQVTAQYQEAVAQVAIEEAQVEEAKINLSYCYMYSPFDGIIGEKFVDVGNLVGGEENTLLANVVQLNPIYVQFSPSVEDMDLIIKYHANMPFRVESSLPSNAKITFPGKVDLINNEAATNTSTVLMRAVIENEKQLLLPGIYLNVNVYLSEKEQALLIPTKAVIQTQGLSSVFVVNAKNQIESHSITTSGQYNQQYIVTSGLQEGDLVVTEGLQKLKAGESVKPTITHG